jgi:hypothetical protein
MEKNKYVDKVDSMLRSDGLIWLESQDIETNDRDFDEFEDIFVNKNYVKLYNTKRYYDDVYPRKICIFQKL